MNAGTKASEPAPSEVIAALEQAARHVETPCGEGTVAWRVFGEDNAGSAPLVLLHGGSGSWLHWIRNIAALATDRLVMVPDMPGNGDSALPETLDMAGICAALEVGLDRILPTISRGGRRAVDLVGFSFGGVVAAFLAARRADLIRRFVMIGIGGLDTPHGETFRRRLAGTSGEERRETVRYNLLGFMLHHPQSADDLALEIEYRNGPRARMKDLADLVLPDKVVAVLPRIAIPLDAIWGEFDRPHPHPKVQERVLRGAQPNMDFRVVAGAGHWANYERAGEFNRLLLEMLAAPVRPVL